MKKNKNSIYILFFLISFSVKAQVDWPFENENTQATMVGSIGESRGSNGVVSRFHKGADLTNGNNYDIYAINGGTVSWYNGGNWNQGTSYIQIGSVYYYHCKPSTSILNAGQGMTEVEEGDYIGSMITTGSIHVHLQENNTNYLNHNLNPYVDSHSPELITTRLTDGYRIFKNGITHNSTTANQNNLLLNSTIEIDNIVFKTIYSKIDIVADIEDRRVSPSGASGGGRTSPFAYEIQLRNYTNPNTTNSLYDFTLTFDEVPNNNASDFVFHPQSTSPGVISTHILTSNPRDTPYDRYFNTTIRNNVTENWANNNTLNARHIGEARFPDNKYRLYIDTYDVDYNDNPNNRLANRIDVPIIIDNFLPYVKEVVVYSPINPAVTLYKGRWGYQNNTLNFIIDVNTTFPSNTPLTIKAYASEPMTELKLTLGGQLYTMTNLAGNHTDFELSVSAPNLSIGLNTLVFSGKDLNNNNLLSNPSLLPVKQASGNWPAGTTTGTDTFHKINIADGSSPFFGADFNTGFCNGQRSSNNTDCLTVCFQDASTPNNNIVQWLWQFDDFYNSTSTLQNPTFTYDSPGIYDVTLTVTNSNNETNSIIKTITVTECDVNIQPNIIANVTSGVGPLTVNFNDLSTGEIDYREWNITPASGWQYLTGGPNSTNPQILFHYAGTYQVNLTLEDEFGESVTSNTIIINVTQQSNTNLYVDFHTEGLVYTGSLISFESATSQGCNNFQYLWTFYDYNGPHYSTLPNTTYSFPVPGNYTVELCVNDDCGNHSCVTKNINISNYTSSVFANMSSTIDNQNWIVEKNQPITFYDISQPNGNILYGSWFFDYHEGASGPDVFYFYPRPYGISHTYTEVGTYRVRLYVGENAAYLGSFIEKTVTVVDEYDYLEIPTIHESYSQTFNNKIFWSIQTKNFDGHLLTDSWNYNSANQEINKRIEVHQKTNSNNYTTTIPILEYNNLSEGQFDEVIFDGYKDKIAVAYRENYSPHDLTRIEIYKRLGDSWSTFELAQTIHYTTPSNNYYFEFIDLKLYNDTLIVSIYDGSSTNTYTADVYVLNPSSGLFEYQAKLISGSPQYNIGGRIDGFGRNVGINNNTIVVGEGLGVTGKERLFTKTDIGWVNSTENAVLTVNNPDYYHRLMNDIKINNNIILTHGYTKGLYIFKKPENDWQNNNLPTAGFRYYNQNIEDYNYQPFGVSGMGSYNISDNGNYIIANGTPIRDFINPVYPSIWKAGLIFYKEGNSWQSKTKEDFRFYPTQGLINNYHLANNNIDEYNNEIVQAFSTILSSSNSRKTILFTYNLEEIDGIQVGQGICYQDVAIENLTINTVQPGAEGLNITIENSNFNNGAGVIYQAINSIVIKPNTEIKQGANFKAKIVDCNLIDQ